MDGARGNSTGVRAGCALACLLLAACGNSRAPAAMSTAGSAGAGGHGGIDGGTGFIAEQCARPPGQPPPITDIYEMRAFLQGRWGLCEPPTLFDQSWPGLEFDAADQWAFLAASEGGALVREYGDGVQGRVAFQIDFQDGSLGPVGLAFFDQSGRVFLSSLTTSEDPRMLIMPREGGAPIRYVALPPGTYELPDGGAEVGDGPATGGDGAEMAHCRTNSDCPAGSYCLVEAAGTSCPTTPIGSCYSGGGGRCPILDPCSCTYSGPSGSVSLDCSALPNTMCGAIAGDGGAGCLTCIPASQSQ